ncbi:MAG: 30S ribosomal protein S4 [Patescibacteria group bacterium]|nr:30S ribosomal protein S4 [Patescibacteria group bacterium]
MQIGPRYKRARYLGVPVFRKTQSQKFAFRAQKRRGKQGPRGGKSEYGRQMLEKQKARYSYGVSSGQFRNYVMKALETTGDNAKNLLGALESRLDNVILRANLAPTRSAARQMVSHGHFTVNGRKVRVPSVSVRVGDIIAIREGSRNHGVLKTVESNDTTPRPAWMKYDASTKQIEIVGAPNVADTSELLFDVRSVLEFYTR